MEVGIRDLRADLSRWIKRVRAGETIVVTDRGTGVARIVPMNGERTIDRLIREGKVIPPRDPGPRRPFRRMKTAQPISDVVRDIR